MSRFPPQCLGGTILWLPDSFNARPIVPTKGFNGTFPYEEYSDSTGLFLSYFHKFRSASLNSSANNPNPGIIAVQPQPEVIKSISSTSITSPHLHFQQK